MIQQYTIGDILFKSKISSVDGGFERGLGALCVSVKGVFELPIGSATRGSFSKTYRRDRIWHIGM